MNSNQKNTDDGSTKQPPASSTIKIYDEGIDPNKKQKPPRRANRTNVLANSNNKFETPQVGEEEVPPHALKKVRGQRKKRWKNRKKSAYHNGEMNNSDHSRNSGFNENYRPHMRGNNQDYRAHEQAKTAEMQPPFPRYIPGNQHTFPIPHPQHSNHRHGRRQRKDADDNTNANGLRASDSQYVSNDNGNGNGYSNGDMNMNNNQSNADMQDSASCKWWVAMIDHNVQVDAVVLSIGGTTHQVLVPPKVGVYLKHELLIQKENFINGNKVDNVGSEASETLRGDTQQADSSAQAFGEYGNAISPSLTGTWDHDTSQYEERRWDYSTASNSDHPHPHSFPHPYINRHPEGQIPYGILVNQHGQPFNGGAAFPPPNNNGPMGMAVPSSNYPMMLPQVQYAPMYPPKYFAMAPEANMYQGNYGPPTGSHANADHTGFAGGMNGENPVNAQGRTVNRHQAKNGRNNVNRTPPRGGANDGIVVEGGNRLRNQIAVTPHRGALGANGAIDARRVSFSPIPPPQETQATVNGDTI